MRLATAAVIVSLGAFEGNALGAQSSERTSAELRAQMARSFPGCVIEEVPDSDLFFALNVEYAFTPTNLQFGLRTGASLAKINIEAGERPITLALNMQRDHIVEFTGSVERVRKVIAATGRELDQVGIGLVGIEPSSVQFLMDEKCRGLGRMLGRAIREGQRPPLGPLMTGIFGREPDRREHVGHAPGLSIPSFAQAAPAPTQGGNRLIITQGRSEREWQTVLEWDDKGNLRQRQELGGRAEAARELHEYQKRLRRLSASEVVASKRVEEPETLPGRAGLLQLQVSGGLRKPTPQETRDWQDAVSEPYRSRLTPHFRFRMKPDWVATRDILLPAGHPVPHVLVPDGVPTPRGPRYGGCFLAPSGFADPSTSAECFGAEKEVIKRLRELPADAAPACRLLTPGDDVNVQAIAVHNAGGSRPGETPPPIDVVVDRPGSVLVVLDSLEPSTWRLRVSGRTRVVGVLMTGYRASTVEGLGADVPVRSVTYEEHAAFRFARSPCVPFLGWQGAAYNGGPAAMMLDRQVEAFTGRKIDVFQAETSRSRFEIR